MIPGPIHHWLKEQLVVAGIPFGGIKGLTAERKETVEQVDHLLEHLSLSLEEIDSSR